MGETFRLLTRVDELRLCERIEREVWGLDDREVLSGTHMRAMIHAGGMAAGAFVDGAMVGFVFGFPSREPDSLGDAALHSHMLAVLPRYRGLRLGLRLKWFQRSWCLRQGLRRVTWTFDPLQLGNARLNLEHLGASSERYLTDFYGRFDSSLSGSVSTDRLLVTWELDDPAVVALAEGRGRDPAAPGAASVLGRQQGNEPGAPRLEAVALTLHLSLPHDFTTMLVESPARAERWRERVRETLTHYFARGYRAVRVVDDGYLLQRPAAVSEAANEEMATHTHRM